LNKLSINPSTHQPLNLSTSQQLNHSTTQPINPSTHQPPMNTVPDKIKKSLQKRQEALDKFTARRTAFLVSKEQIKNEIVEARAIWAATLAQMPNLPFSG